ncbi:hypothetical protein [Streptomyces sp. NPDC049887]|uniref:hypothetical protein n=1 Tax=unclassified Streptomyces TaxID=2593676 RepID=UPI00341DAFC8
MTDPRARRSRHRASRVLARVLFAALAVVGLLWTALGISEGGAAVGVTGVRGTLTVEHCEERPGARGGTTTDCRGTFVSADDRITDGHAETQATEARPGDRLEVRRVFTGLYVVQDTSEAHTYLPGVVGGAIAGAVGIYGMFRAPKLSGARASWRSRYGRTQGGR